MPQANEEHRRAILDQFTRQAVPFSQMRDHSPELILTELFMGESRQDPNGLLAIN
jgi:hypothetical protein